MTASNSAGYPVLQEQQYQQQQQQQQQQQPVPPNDNNQSAPQRGRSRPRSQNVVDSTSGLLSTTSKIPFVSKKRKLKEPTSSLSVSILNTIKLLVGSGMLSLPWAFAHVGIWPSVFALILCGTFDLIGAMMLIVSTEITQEYEYSALLKYLSPMWEFLGAVCVLYVVSGSLVGYLILFGDFITDALAQCGVPDFPFQRNIYIIGFSVLVITPLILLRDLSALRFSSFVGVAAILYVVVLMIYFMVEYSSDPNFVLGAANEPTSFVESMNWNMGWFIVTNVATQAFVCHYSIQRIYLDLKQRSIRRMLIVCVSATVFCIVLYMTFGMCGYLLYGSKVPSDVIVSFNGGPYVVVARFAMILSVGGTFPLAFVSCQATLEDKFFNPRKNPVWNFENKPYLRNVVKLATMIFYLILGTTIPTIGPVVSINGAISTLGLIFGFPILTSWVIGFSIVPQSVISGYGSVQEYVMSKKSSIPKKIKIAMGAMLILGLFLGITGLVMEFVEV